VIRRRSRQGLRAVIALVALFLLAAPAQGAADLPAVVGGVKGVVKMPTGQPVVRAFVHVIPLGKGACCVPDIAILTRRHGAYRTPGLHPGDYRIRITKKGFVSASKKVVVRGGKTTIANFILRGN
jgi:hypothetical protein